MSSSFLTFLSYTVSPDPACQFRLAIGSYVEQYSNAVQIVKKRPEENSLYVAGAFEHPYPCTKILWSPDVSATQDLLATTGDYLRIWGVTDDGSGTGKVTPEKVALLNNVRTVLYITVLYCTFVSNVIERTEQTFLTILTHSCLEQDE
jgi:WD repeat-containing protein 68